MGISLAFSRFESVTYYFKSEDRELFLSNILHIIDSAKRKIKKREKSQGDLINFRKRAQVYQIVSSVPSPMNKRIIAMEHSSIFDSLEIHKLSDYVSYQEEFTSRASTLMASTHLCSEFEFDELSDILCQVVVEGAFSLKHPAV